MAPPVRPDSLGPATTSQTFDDFTSDINLTAAKGGPCRRLRINAAGSGDLALRYADGSSDTITGLTAGDILDVQAAAILSTGTTVGAVTIFW